MTIIVLRYNFFAFIFLCLMCSCFEKKQEQSLSQSFIAAENGIYAELGTGYDSASGRIMAHKCLEPIAALRETNIDSSLNTNFLAYNNDANIRFVENADFESIFSGLFGSFIMTIPVYPGVEVGGGVRFSLSNGKSSSKMNKIYSVALNKNISSPLMQKTKFFENLLIRIKDQRLNDEEARKLIRKNCGNEFISSINTAGSLTIALDLDFSSVANYEKYAPKFVLELLGGIGRGEGEVRICLDKFSESIRFKVSAFQVGGVPENLSRLFPKGFPECTFKYNRANAIDACTNKHANAETDKKDFSWTTECQEVIKKLYDYATSPTNIAKDLPSFPIQMADVRNQPFVPVGYNTSVYTEEDLALLKNGLKSNFKRDEIVSEADNSKFIDNIRLVIGNINLYEIYSKKLISFIEYPTNEGLHETLFRKAKEQLTKTNSAKEKLVLMLEKCWIERNDCVDKKQIENNIDEARKDAFLDEKIFDYNAQLDGVYTWCKLLGPRAKFSEESLNFEKEDFPFNGLKASDADLVVKLYKIELMTPPIFDENAELNLHNTCQKLSSLMKVRFGSSVKIDSKILKTKSLRLFDSYQPLKDLEVRNNFLNEYPVFYFAEKLENLDISYNFNIYLKSFDQVLKFEIPKISTWPNSLKCVNLSEKNFIGSDEISKEVFKYLKVPKVIMFGFNLNAIPNEEVKEIYVENIELIEEQWSNFVNSRKNPLEIFVKDSHIKSRNFNVTFAQYKNVKVSKFTNQNYKCIN